MKIIKKILRIVAVLIITILIIGCGIWLIDGRSPQAIIIGHVFTQSTMEDYKKVKGDLTDKSTVEIPGDVKFPREMRQYRIGNMQVFHMEAQDATMPIVLYIHGGANLHHFNEQHGYAMAEWATVTGCGIVTPNYPLLYRYTAADAHPLMMQLDQQLVKQYPANRLIIMGDSAGGGFTLALAQQICCSDSLELPSHLALISPWVDVLGGDDTLQEYDTFLNMEVLRHIGSDWAGNIDPHDPKISPLYGNMQSLPPTDLYTGTWETLYTDIVNTYDKMKAAGVDARLHVAEKMGHVYPLWPCPEGNKARKEIAEIIATHKKV